MNGSEEQKKRYIGPRLATLAGWQHIKVDEWMDVFYL